MTYKIKPKTTNSASGQHERSTRSSRSDPLQLLTIDHVSLEDLRAYVDHLERGLNNKPATQAHKIGALRSLFAFAENEDWLTTLNPARRLVTPKLPDRQPIYFTATESREMLARIDAGAGRNKVRDRAIVTLFLHAGLRLSELVGLDLENLDLEEGTLRVMGKGNKERVLPLSREVQRCLQAYLEVRPHADTPAIFLSHFKKRMTADAIE